MGSFNGQLKQVIRRLLRAPMFTSVAILTLALGIGANTAVFSVVEGVLLKPLPYPHSEQLVALSHAAPGINIPDVTMSPSMYFTYRDQNRAFQDLGLYTSDTVSITGTGEPEQVRAVDVTDGVIPILGIRPMLGHSLRVRTIRREARRQSCFLTVSGAGDSAEIPGLLAAVFSSMEKHGK